MNCNCAIIASDKVGSSKDLVKNNGFIFNYSKVEELTSCIEKLISDDNLLEKFKIESKKIIKDFSFEKDLEALKIYFKKKKCRSDYIFNQVYLNLSLTKQQKNNRKQTIYQQPLNFLSSNQHQHCAG